MIDAVIARRRAERQSLLSRARAWGAEAGPVLGADAIVVIGSVARGDFNKWSDVDVLVVCEGLPGGGPARQDAVASMRPPPGFEVIAWTPAELAARVDRGTDPMAIEAYGSGVVVYGELPV